jgi:hypothetical protein
MTENEIIAHARLALCYLYIMRGNIRAIQKYAELALFRN